MYVAMPSWAAWPNVQLDGKQLHIFLLIDHSLLTGIVCFKTGPFECLRDVPQLLMYLTIIYGPSHADRWTSAHCLDVSTSYEAFLRMCASYVIVVEHIVYILKILHIMIVYWDTQ